MLLAFIGLLWGKCGERLVLYKVKIYGNSNFLYSEK